MYTVDYFIDKFSAIPEDKWAIYTQHDGKGRHCALGWCRYKHQLNNGEYRRDYDWSEEQEALMRLFIKAGLNTICGGETLGDVAYVNNGTHPKFQQPTPKKRILAALLYIKAYEQREEITDPPVTVEDILSEPVEA